MEWYRFYVLLMVILLIISIMVRSIIHIKITNKNPNVVGKGKKGFAKYREEISVLVLNIAIIFVIFYCSYEPLHKYFIYFSSLNTLTLKIFGSLTIMLGYLFIVTAFIQMGKSWRIGIDVETEDALVTKRIFSISRNPIFLGIDLYFFGIFMLFPNWIFGLILLLTFLGIHWQIIEEERFLRIKYGKDYETYANQTGRYLSIKRIRMHDCCPPRSANCR